MRTETRRNSLVKDFPWLRWSVFLLIAATSLAWDLWTKWAVFDWLGTDAQGADHLWLGGLVRFRFRTTFNFGALWGMGQQMTWLFATLSVVAAVAILWWVFAKRAALGWWLTVCLGLILGGTLGNLFDRLGLHGWSRLGLPVRAVRDFLDFQFRGPWGEFDWAIFNFADTYLVAGAIMLVIYSFWAETAASPANPLPEQGTVANHS